MRNVFDNLPKTEGSGENEDDPRKQRRDQQPVIAMFGDDVEYDHDEGAGRTSYLNPRAAEGGNEEAGNDRGDEALVGRRAAGDAQGHGQRQRDDRDCQPGDCIGPEDFCRVPLAKHGHELRLEDPLPHRSFSCSATLS